MVDIDDYGWISADPFPGLGEAACMTVVVGKQPESVLLNFGSDGTERVSMPEVINGRPGATVSVLDAVDGVIAIEINGSQGAREEVLGPASWAGKAASVYWNVNGQTRFACARRGRMLCDIDLLFDEGVEGLPGSLRRLLPADRRNENLEAVGASMVEAFTGVRITRQMIAGLEVAFVVHPVLAPLELETADDTALSYSHAGLVAQIVAAGVTSCRQIAEWAALQSIERADLRGEPRIQSITTQFGNGTPAVETRELIELVVKFDRNADQAAASDDAREPDEWGDIDLPPSPETLKCWQRQWAASALRHCCISDAVSAAIGAVSSATNCFGIDDQEVEFVDNLTRTFGLEQQG